VTPLTAEAQPAQERLFDSVLNIPAREFRCRENAQIKAPDPFGSGASRVT
jgi:hypothetical protein